MVEIDDMILYNNKSKLIIVYFIDKFTSMCHYEKDLNEFSLSLIEKAYKKVYGEY